MYGAERICRRSYSKRQTKNIGKCDSDFFSRNTAAGVKNFVGKTITFAQETISGTNKNTIDTKQAYDDLTNEDKFNATKTNLVRSQLFSFVEMYKANIVSYKEAEIKQKLAMQLMLELQENGYIDFISHKNVASFATEYTSQISVAKFHDLEYAYVDKYGYFLEDKEFSLEEIKEAIKNTFPERFLT